MEGGAVPAIDMEYVSGSSSDEVDEDGTSEKN